MSKLYSVGGFADNTWLVPSMEKDTSKLSLEDQGCSFIESPGIYGNWTKSNDEYIKNFIDVTGPAENAFIIALSDGANAAARIVVENVEDVRYHTLVLISPGPFEEPGYLSEKAKEAMKGLHVLILYTDGELDAIKEAARAYQLWFKRNNANVTIYQGILPQRQRLPKWLRWIIRPHLYGIQHHLERIVKWGTWLGYRIKLID